MADLSRHEQEANRRRLSATPERAVIVSSMQIKSTESEDSSDKVKGTPPSTPQYAGQIDAFIFCFAIFLMHETHFYA